MAGVKGNNVGAGANLTGGDSTAVADFAVVSKKRVIRENALVSPLSVLCALAMIGQRREETLAQMEEGFGLSVPNNDYLHIS